MLLKVGFKAKGLFFKPTSHHLFPIRVSEYKQFDVVNYQELDICKPGRVCGKTKKLPLYKFLKEPLVKKYGEEWYKELEVAVVHLFTKKTLKGDKLH